MSERDSARLNGVLGSARRPGPVGLDPSRFPATPQPGQPAATASVLSAAAAGAPSHDNQFGGYFTIERHIVGLTVREIESKVGYRAGLLAAGARIFVFTQQPEVGQFVFAGSTLYSDAEGLVTVEQRLKAASTVIPGAWLHERLIKIVPVQAPPAERDSYPQAESPVEQWQLLVRLPAELVCELRGEQRYYPR
jgi:hypothetical protein